MYRIFAVHCDRRCVLDRTTGQLFRNNAHDYLLLLGFQFAAAVIVVLVGTPQGKRMDTFLGKSIRRLVCVIELKRCGHSFELSHNRYLNLTEHPRAAHIEYHIFKVRKVYLRNSVKHLFVLIDGIGDYSFVNSIRHFAVLLS